MIAADKTPVFAAPLNKIMADSLFPSAATWRLTVKPSLSPGGWTTLTYEYTKYDKSFANKQIAKGNASRPRPSHSNFCDDYFRSALSSSLYHSGTRYLFKSNWNCLLMRINQPNIRLIKVVNIAQRCSVHFHCFDNLFETFSWFSWNAECIVLILLLGNRTQTPTLRRVVLTTYVGWSRPFLQRGLVDAGSVRSFSCCMSPTAEELFIRSSCDEYHRVTRRCHDSGRWYGMFRWTDFRI